MNINISLSIFKSEYILLGISSVFFCLMCISFLADKGIVLFEFGIYTISTSGVFGIISVSLFGLYASKKGHPEASFGKHFSVVFMLTFLTVVIYLSSYTLAYHVIPGG